MKITYIGHATLLIETEGVRLLTDPNFDPRLAHVLKRIRPPGVALKDIGHIDAILLTHAHADHLSILSLRALGDVSVIAPPAVAMWLRKLGFRSEDMAPGQEIDIGGVRVQTAAATHKGHRYGVDTGLKDANMYLLSTMEHSCFFAGDTALVEGTAKMAHDHRKETGRQLDVALLPIGYASKWKEKRFRKGHLTSQDALDLAAQLDARAVVPYHWGTFNHFTSGADDAIKVFRRLAETHERGKNVRILDPGETLNLSELRA